MRADFMAEGCLVADAAAIFVGVFFLPICSRLYILGLSDSGGCAFIDLVLTAFTVAGSNQKKTQSVTSRTYGIGRCTVVIEFGLGERHTQFWCSHDKLTS
jgi:hypothetical protein